MITYYFKRIFIGGLLRSIHYIVISSTVFLTDLIRMDGLK
jgi:hypothetical protein